VHAITRDAIESFQPQLRGKSVMLDSHFRASRHFVYGDPGRLRQVLVNLLSNAIKFTDVGSVEVETCNDESGSIRIAVRDTGIGLDIATLNGLFKSFEQHRGDSSRGGLGLAICRGVIEAHEGRIWATSAGEGRGSTFEVELPTTRAAETDAQPFGGTYVDSTSEEGIRSMRILIVEDDDDTAAILRDLLGQEGHALGVVHSVREAQRPVDKPWDIVISDLGLPDGSGFDVARHFGGVTPRPRLIALSGYGSETDLTATSAAGFERHLVKPIDLGQLRQALTL
jgi:CheY-like chemotaxis protein